MRNISVSAFINTIFGLVLALLLTALFLFISWDGERQRAEMINRYKLISNLLLSTAKLQLTDEREKKFYKDFSIRPVSVDESKLLLLNINKRNIIFESESVYGKMEIFSISKNRYIYLQRFGYSLMLQDMKSYDTRIMMTILIAILITTLFIILYIGIMRKLSPLKKLHRQIEEFSQGNMDIKINQRSTDEIGKIAKSFDDALHYIRTLLESKNLFMRNMMHELKTPITKGRIAIEMVEDGSSKEVLIRAFERMNQLIGELAHVERLTTQNFQPQIIEVSIDTVIEDAISLLLCDRTKLTIQTEHERLKTDSKLLSLALKNLLDNALKYGEDEQASIVSRPQSIKVISKGKGLEYPLGYYLEPFTQEEKRNPGFGLGLYIVNNIANRLNYTLNYYHKNHYNIFELRQK
ncbi:MAG TPA: HAMP domain-containing histidine kinase [Campylobacterales bacterium]|nr:HAMP domain-containing histidine kinase [Campylobacterales bacterium]HHS93323.1 HAMP domain-containing histidine kinase [Campylobacterales bacterium]